LEGGKARQESLSILRTSPGRRAMSHALAEHIYPIEWDSAKIPQNVGIQLSRPSAQDDVPGKDASEEQLPPFTIPSSATAFEARYCGFILQADVVLGDDHKTIELSIAPEHVTLTGRTKWGQGVSQLETPDFETQGLATSITAQAGIPRLLGTMNRPPVSKVEGDSAKRIWFAFVTASFAR
jgi:hypothetical protein